MSPRLLEDRERLLRLYPPRTTRAISPATLGRYTGLVAQYKYDDIRTLIFLFPEGRSFDVQLRTRQRQLHREYRLTAGMKEALLSLSLDRSKHHVLDGGIIRHLPERPIVLWDILVHDSQYLVGTTYRSRYALLKKVCGQPGHYEELSGSQVGLVVRGNLWLAPLFVKAFTARYRRAVGVECLEGLLLKNPEGRLTPGLTEDNNGAWQLKARKPKPGYLF